MTEQCKNEIHSVVIIGGGCAGLTSAIYAARAEMKPLLFSGTYDEKGGLLVKTSIVENFPGFPSGVMGFDLMQNMEEQAKNHGATIIDKLIVDVDLESRPFIVTDEKGVTYRTKSIIVATGSKPNKLNLEFENIYWSRGISSCAVCDGALFKNKKIVVVGGGDSAMEEALFLTKFSDVTLIHRRDTFRASNVMQSRVKENKKITILYDTTVERLIGDDVDNVLKFIEIKNHKTGEIRIIAVDGMFYGLGLTPNTYLFKDQLSMDNEGYILAGSDLSTKNINCHYETMTSVPGVFVAGDARDKIYRQAVVACGDGCRAALDAYNYCQSF